MCVLCVDVCVCMYCPRRHSLDKPIIIHIFVQPQYTINTTIITITITTTFYLEGTVCICVVPEGIHVTSTLNMHLLLCATVLLSKVKIIKKNFSKVALKQISPQPPTKGYILFTSKPRMKLWKGSTNRIISVIMYYTLGGRKYGPRNNLIHV